MSRVIIFKSREEYLQWLKYKSDNIKIISVVNKAWDSDEGSFQEAHDIYTVSTERRSASEHG